MLNNGDIHFIGFNKYSRSEPKENDYYKWVVNGFKDNVFNSNYQDIIRAYNGSTTNRAINNSYVKMAYGRGLAIHDMPLDTPLLTQFHEKLSKKDLRNVVMDYQLLNEFSVVVHRQSGVNKNKIAKIEHISKSNVIPSIADEDGIIRSYWYSPDWSQKNRWKTKYKPVEYPALGFAKDFNFEMPEIYVGRSYQIGQEYFSLPDYEASLQYCFIEEEISNYYHSHVVNGMSFGSIVNVPNSSDWDDSQKKQYIKDVKGRYAGSSGAGRIAFNFMKSDAEPTTITNVENNTSHKQWDFLTKEASSKIISGHECPSPAIVGLASASGFNSKADEMDMMEQQLLKRVIAPKQEFILEGIAEIFEYFNEEFPDVYFRPLTEIEGEDEEKEKVNEEENQENNEAENVEENIEMSKKKSEFDFLEQYAEDEPIGYELNRVDYDITEPLNLASTANSEQDTKLWKVRYAYNIGTSKTPIGQSRSFCNKMMQLSRQGKVFRKEDIEKMSRDGVNGEFAHSGGKYDIFLYAGGVNCYHRWERRIYKKRRDEDGNPLGGNAMQNTFPVSVSEARRQGFTPPKNSKDVAIAEIDKPNKGAYPS